MNPIRLAPVIVAAVISFTSAPTLAVQFQDDITFSTRGQSLWQAGPSSTWSYNSGFLGTTWGTFANTKPVSYGLNAMTGSARSLVPGTGIHVPNPLYPVEYPIWKLCPFDCGPEPSPTIYVPPQYIDTRSGVDLSAKTSGKIGISVHASSGGGDMSLQLPFRVNLNMPDAPARQTWFSITGQASLGSGAGFKVTAPYVVAGVNASVHTDSLLGITSCAFGQCAGATSAQPSFHTDFQAVNFDTRNAKPLTVAGLPVNNVVLNTPGPIVAGIKVVGTQTIYAPKDRSGGTVDVNNRTVILKTSEPLAQFDLNIADIVGAVVLPFVPLSATLQLGVGTVEGIAFSENVGVKLGLNHRLVFQSGGVRAALEFDQPVYVYDGLIGAIISYGNIVYLNLDETQRFSYLFPGEAGRLVSRTYALDGDRTFRNEIMMSIDPVITSKAGCYDLSAQGLPTESYCALDSTYQTTNLLEVLAYHQGYQLDGFNTVTLAVAVPEPAAWILMAAGFGAIFGLGRRRHTNPRPSTH